MRPVELLVLVVLASGCGASAPRPAPDSRCEGEEAAVQTATTVHDDCVSSGGELTEDDGAYTALAARLEAHELGLATTPGVPEEDAMELANGYWAYLDQIASRFTDHGPLDHAEDAAEAIVRDREGDGAVQAVRLARAALEELHTLMAPAEGSAPPRCLEEADMIREANDELERCRGSGAP